ncbi:MAG: L,D-transpeptidase [Planctomycetota bacterium]|jgi:hypothetical protein
MVLQSQLIRPVNRRSHMYRRPRRKRSLALIASLILPALALLVALKLSWGRERPGGSAARPQQAVGEAGAGETPANAATDGEEPGGPEPAVSRPAEISIADGPPDPSGVTGTRAEAAEEVGQQPLGRSLQPSPDAWRQARRQLASGLPPADLGQPIEARRTLSAALASTALDPEEARSVREAVGTLNQRLVFSPEIVEGDPFTRSHIVQPNERLGTIVQTQSLRVDWRFIMRINGIPDERLLRAGRRLKLVTGPFHAAVHKSDFRLDLYLGSGAGRVFVASYPVGLGEWDSTPLGDFRVRRGSKLTNPAWTNPHTGEQYGRFDPTNPIGERWIGLEGMDESTRDLMGYGIHGTIEPDSVGRQSSMGCIRMLPDDVEIIYEVLMEGVSTVEIVP